MRVYIEVYKGGRFPPKSLGGFDVPTTGTLAEFFQSATSAWGVTLAVGDIVEVENHSGTQEEYYRVGKGGGLAQVVRKGRRWHRLDKNPAHPERAHYAEMTRHPGKFEGEPAYVPYFWECYLDGGADDDDGEVLTFNVTTTDIDIFPELKRRKRVRLMERLDGFVVEV